VPVELAKGRRACGKPSEAAQKSPHPYRRWVPITKRGGTTLLEWGAAIGTQFF
jgi:hypothetical protein